MVAVGGGSSTEPHLFVLRKAIDKHDKADKYINRKKGKDTIIYINRLKGLSNVYTSICFDSRDVWS